MLQGEKYQYEIIKHNFATVESALTPTDIHIPL